MHDIRVIRTDLDAFDAALARRGLAPVAAELSAIDERHRAIQTELQQLQARRNEASREIGQRKKTGAGADDLIAEVASIKSRVPELEFEATRIAAELEERLATLPNLPDADVPDGPDESANRVERVVGTPPRLDFDVRDHVAVGEALGGMDFELAARLSGARFVVLTGALARLERALASFMLDIHTREFGYLETIPPFLVRDAVMYGTGQLPKFAEDSFRTTDDRWLIPTAEVPLTNFGMDRIFAPSELPLRLTAYTPCFRAEAGAAGRDTRGMIRQHQFSKVELVSITTPDASAEEHERMTACAETVLQRLELPYRVVTLCTGDLGFAARKTYDIEVWLPAQDCYREISSCSNCGDFQARRMAARYRPEGQRRTELVHTLNGSALAVGRTMVALIENGQRGNGTVVLPEALHPYMGGVTEIGLTGADADG